MHFLLDYENRRESGTFIGSFTFKADKKPLSVDPELVYIVARKESQKNSSG